MYINIKHAAFIYQWCLLFPSKSKFTIYKEAQYSFLHKRILMQNLLLLLYTNAMFIKRPYNSGVSLQSADIRQCCFETAKHLNNKGHLLLYPQSFSLLRRASFPPHLTGSHSLCSGISQRSFSSSWVKKKKGSKLKC